MTDIILKAEHLKKVFISGKKSMTAVDDVSFGLERGECLGIVGAVRKAGDDRRLQTGGFDDVV